MRSAATRLLAVVTSLFALAVVLPVPAKALPTGPTVVTIEKITDGDTIRVWAPGYDEYQKVRILGINTPEVNWYGKPGECFGPEAAAFAEELMPVGSTVTLVADPTQSDTDRHGRWLRYVDLPDGSDYSVRAVETGHAAYREYDGWLQRSPELIAAQERAIVSGAGAQVACA